MPDFEARCALLEAENETLRERVAQLEEQLAGTLRMPIEFGLTSKESTVLGVMMQRDIATKTAIHTALYAMRAEGEEAEPKIVDVFVCKIRRKLKPFGIEIKTRWGEGYYLTAETKQLLRDVCGSRLRVAA